jgi:formimidoylglutamate deiminase
VGTDSQIQIDLLEDVRELEYNLRLQKLERAILSPENGNAQSLAQRLFNCVTVGGAQSLGASAGEFTPNSFADFFTVSLDDASIAGASEDDLLTSIIFSLNRTAIREVVVGGKMIVEEGRHKDQDEIVRRFRALQKELWG